MQSPVVVPQVAIVTGGSQASCRPFMFVTRRCGIGAPAPFVLFPVIRMLQISMYAMYVCIDRYIQCIRLCIYLSIYTHASIYLHTCIFMYDVDLCEKRGAPLSTRVD